MSENSVLILESRDGIRNMLSDNLKKEGMRVFSTNNLLTANSILEKKYPQTIIMDINKESVELLRTINQNKINVVCMIDKSNTELYPEIKNNQVFFKPFHLNQLTKIIKK